MGNYRFRLSDMLPNAWFYKLRDMSKTKISTTTTNNHHKKPPYASYYSSSTTTPPPPQNHHFSHPKNHHTPRKSSKKLIPNRKTIYKPSPKHTSLTESTHILQDFFPSPTTIQSPSSESTQSPLTSCTCRISSSTSDIIIDVTEAKNIDFSPENNLKLPPIITKPMVNSSKKVKEITNQTPARKSLSGLKLRSNSPKLAVLNKRNIQKSSQRKTNMSESFAVVKTSFDPQKDFKESMMEMIMENNIRASKDLEELLACYLSLNSDEYHDVIVKAFEQIWFSLPDLLVVNN